MCAKRSTSHCNAMLTERWRNASNRASRIAEVDGQDVAARTVAAICLCIYPMRPPPLCPFIAMKDARIASAMKMHLWREVGGGAYWNPAKLQSGCRILSLHLSHAINTILFTHGNMQLGDNKSEKYIWGER
jgi:hypothetical protein